VVILDIMRTIAWIVAGIAVVTVIAGTVGAVLQIAFPSSYDDQGIAHDLKLFVITLCCTVAAYVAGGFVANRGKLFAGVLFAVGAIGTYFHYDKAPRWYHIANLASIAPAALLGSRLRKSRS
jgi:type III secretory pathway component EscS